MTNTLTPSQTRMMDEVTSKGRSNSPTGGSGREFSRDCSAWHRTASSLVRKGLCDMWANGSVFFVCPRGTEFKPEWMPKSGSNPNWHKCHR